MPTKELSTQERNELMTTLQTRFEENMHRHVGIQWTDVQKKLEHSPSTLWSLNAMEKTGGEPDVISFKEDTYMFVDCSAESPADRRSLCYDKEALESRKANKPIGNAVDTAIAMGITLLTEEEYKQLQSIGDFDLKTSSWLLAPQDVRQKGGSIFGDKRYGRAFIYHNGAESYYAARGFRGKIYV